MEVQRDKEEEEEREGTGGGVGGSQMGKWTQEPAGVRLIFPWRALNSQGGIMQSSNLQTHYLRSGKTRSVIEPENHTGAGDAGEDQQLRE